MTKTKTKTKTEPVSVETALGTLSDPNDHALMQAAIRIGAALVAKHGVLNCTPTEATLLAQGAYAYALAIVTKVRG